VSELMVIELAPAFLRVTVLVALVVFSTTTPKFTAVTEIVVCAAAKAVENKQNIAVSETRTTL
jgi:hypothetical protein